jgi:hypothetical protein
MAVSTSVTLPSGVIAARAQVHPVTITVTGLVANTNYMALWNRPGSPVSERVVTSDQAGSVILIDNPQSPGTHTFQLSTAGFDTFIPSAPTMSTVELKPTATVGSTTSYSVGL